MATGRIYKEASEGKWRNLETGREITRRPRGIADFWFVSDPRVAGSRERLTYFFQELKLPLPELTSEPILASEEKKVKKALVPLARETPEELALRISRLTTAAIPTTNIIGIDALKHVTPSVLRIPSNQDIRRIPWRMLTNLNPFTLNGLETIAAVLEVKDGDTYDLAFSMPLRFLSPDAKSNEENIIMRDTFRLYGVDAAEKNTIQGQIAKRLVMNIVDESGGYLQGVFRDWEKYGRPMIDLYTKDGESIVDLLTSVRHPKFGRIALPYFGAGKDAYMKSLPVYKILKGELVDKQNKPFPIDIYVSEL